MNLYIALLRGINVSGHKKFPKAEQLQMISNLGFQKAQVYIHTGNWIFSASEGVSEVKTKIENAILATYGWEIPVLVLKTSEVEQIFKACPFSEEIKEQSYFTLLNSTPPKAYIDALIQLEYKNEEFHVTSNCIYIFYKNGAGAAKFTNNVIERKLKVSATSRNFRTMAKLINLASS